MPAVVAVPLITGAIAGGASIYGSHKASGSARRAMEVQASSDRAALEDARAQREEERRANQVAEEQKAREFAAAEEERQYARRLQEEREARQAPYRAMSAQALGSLGQLLGIQMPQMPTGGAPSGTSTTPRPPMSGPLRPLSPETSGPMYGKPPMTIGDLTGMRNKPRTVGY